MKRAVLVLAMHGAPPLDFPRSELQEFMALHGRVAHGDADTDESLRLRYLELEKKMRTWPRNAENDPFYAGSGELAQQLRQETGLEVILGFNEFCAPSIDEAIGLAASLEAETIVVVTPMMTRGGEHSEVEIAAAIERGRALYPGKKIIYAWPFAVEEVARFLASHIKKYI